MATVKPFVSCSLPSESQINKEKDPEKRELMKQRRADGLKFLKENQAAAIIKTSISADLGKDAAAKAIEAVALLKKLGIEAETAVGVHAQTLLSWVKERMAAGKPVDEEAFAIFSGKKAVIEKPKTK
jgi:hypothetical protein